MNHEQILQEPGVYQFESVSEIPLAANDSEGQHLSKQEQIQVRVETEKREAKERFKDMIDMVSRRYREQGSLSEKMLEEFIAHNDEVLESAIEYGILKGFSSEQLKKLEIAAVLHDMTKADAVPEHLKDVPNYILACHGEAAAEESFAVLTDEFLASKGFQGDFEVVRQEISRAIREHMGPHPGFMDGILAKANEKLRELGEAEIRHPKAEGAISEALLTVDMRSLAGEKGRKKVLAIRAAVPVFKVIDQKTVEEYAALGVDLSMGEAALLSGFQSAFEAQAMLADPEGKAWLGQEIESSKNREYHYGSGVNEVVVRWAQAESKRQRYEDLKRASVVQTELAGGETYREAA